MLSSALFALLLPSLPWVSGANGACSISPETQAQRDTVLSLAYGHPMIQFQNYANVTISNAGGANAWDHERQFPTPDTDLPTPNHDTLYSFMAFDLSHNDLVLTIPKVPSSQFHIFEFLDPYGENIAIIGSNNMDSAGRWLLRPSATGPYGANLLPGDQEYTGIINSFAHTGGIVGRFLVYNESSYAPIHAWQDQLDVALLARPDRNPPCKRLEDGLLKDPASSSPAMNALTLMANLGLCDVPRNVGDRAKVNEFLRGAGISAGSYKQPPGVNLTAAYQAEEAAAYKAMRQPDARTKLGNGWTMVSEAMAGHFGDNYAARSGFGTAGYWMLDARNALYPSWSNSSDPAPLNSKPLYVGPNESLIFTFSSKPPLKDIGFWSVTGYRANHHLIPNDEGVYKLGSTSNLTYPNGEPLYKKLGSRDSGKQDFEKSFQLLIQPDDVKPPESWRSNWLPAPAGGRKVQLILRLYCPTQELLDGKWEYPIVTRQDAITA